tara:strand:+ start:185 stop:616 length:432 start_codon:yes stop_codon:yes gene_type:complete
MATVIKPKRSETALSIPAASALQAGELAMNVTDGKFYTKTTGGTVKELGGAGSVSLQDVVTNGASSNQDILLDGANLVFEGFLANAYETTLTAAEPTVDRTITLPNVSGTVITTGNLTIDGTPTGDVLVGEGDSLAFAIVFGS